MAMTKVCDMFECIVFFYLKRNDAFEHKICFCHNNNNIFCSLRPSNNVVWGPTDTGQ